MRLQELAMKILTTSVLNTSARAGRTPPPRAAGHPRDAAPRRPRGAALRDPDDRGHQARDVHAA